MVRPLRAFSLIEVTLVFVLLATASALIMPRLLSGDQAGTARRAQASVELAASSALEASTSTGSSLTDLTVLETLAPRLTFLDSTTTSAGPDAVSVSAPAASFVAAAADGSGFCWGLILNFSSTGQSSVFLTTEAASCSASLFAAQVGTIPPPDSGTSWSNPWIV